MISATEPGLRANRANSLEQCGPAGHVKMRHNIIKQQQGRAAKPPRLQARMRQHHGNQQRLLLAGRGKMRRRAGMAVDGIHVTGMRPGKRHVARHPALTRHRDEPVLGLQCRPFGKPCLDRAVECQPDPGKIEPSLCRLGVQIGNQCLARCRHGDGRFGKAGLNGDEPRLVRTALGKQRCTFAKQLFIPVRAANMRRIKGDHQPVKEPPARAGAVDENAIHTRRQPRDRQQPANFGLRHRLTIPPHDPAPGLAASQNTGADPHCFVGCGKISRNRPLLTATILAWQMLGAGAAQATARGQQRYRLHQIGLARPILTKKQHVRSIDHHPAVGVIAEVPKRQ